MSTQGDDTAVVVAARGGPRKGLLLDVTLAVAIFALALYLRWLAFRRRPPSPQDVAARCCCGRTARPEEPALRWRSGDVVLFSSDDLSNRMALRSPWNHSATLIVNPHTREQYVWESNIANDKNQAHGSVDVLSGKPRDGPQLLLLGDKLARYRGRVWVRRLCGPYDGNDYEDAEARREGKREDKRRYETLMALVRSEAKRGFEKNCAYWMLSGMHMQHLLPTPPPLSMRRRAARPAWDDEELAQNAGKPLGRFCSELNALALRALGALRADVEPGRVLPPDLAQSPTSEGREPLLAKGWRLSPPIPLHTCDLVHAG
ncbi:Hypothetical protein UVM_LOCUS429 [uncultured virus]|nr:Hypothetical protein UVM_LOCUS429 [uncultured virus]